MARMVIVQVATARLATVQAVITEMARVAIVQAAITEMARAVTVRVVITKTVEATVTKMESAFQQVKEEVTIEEMTDVMTKIVQRRHLWLQTVSA